MKSVFPDGVGGVLISCGFVQNIVHLQIEVLPRRSKQPLVPQNLGIGSTPDPSQEGPRSALVGWPSRAVSHPETLKPLEIRLPVRVSRTRFLPTKTLRGTRSGT